MNILVFGSSNKNSNRASFIDKYHKINKKPQYKLLKIENLEFKKLDFENLFEIEKYIASCVDIILIFLESAGSIAELATFLHDKHISNKMLIIIEEELFHNESFITEAIFKHFYKKCAEKPNCLCNGKDKICNNMIIINKNLNDNKDERQISYNRIITTIELKKDKIIKPQIINEITTILNENPACNFKEIEKSITATEELFNYLKSLALLKIIKTKLINNETHYYIENKKNMFQYNKNLQETILDIVYIPNQLTSEEIVKQGKTYYKPSMFSRSVLADIKQLLEKDFKPHATAFAYIKGKTILDNVKIHKDNSYILKLDLEHFFPSIKLQNFINLASKYFNIETDNNLLMDICRLCFINDKLPVGFSTSPLLSNLFMYELDEELFNYCKELDIQYSRYADDMTFSHKDKGLLPNHETKLIQIIENYNNLKINKKKTIHASKANIRKITGLVIDNNTNTISIGRKRKKKIKLLLKIHSTPTHKYYSGSRGYDYKIKGHLLWLKSVDRTYYDKLKKNLKYKNVITEIEEDLYENPIYTI